VWRDKVIIDNLLNLELLFWVAAKTQNQTLHDMAVSAATTLRFKHSMTLSVAKVSHVDRTAQFWIRPDGSTYHLVVFNPETGAVISRSG
jgi:unsaturated chondroitin disaccharide hydrolase